ncbi:hypothetical protein BXZ70DRAFT_730869 [Cristinia sonorae]|uniref:Uncharacterized protein n=1 Tax=Cristinia sonorae TaxID=1940300 RepID=A0A8K0UTD0_9AGAR|nr:hypothetical protein BXZ70DRAFT_730869 [Cristinia sonorae]
MRNLFRPIFPVDSSPSLSWAQSSIAVLSILGPSTSTSRVTRQTDTIPCSISTNHPSRYIHTATPISLCLPLGLFKSSFNFIKAGSLPLPHSIIPFLYRTPLVVGNGICSVVGFLDCLVDVLASFRFLFLVYTRRSSLPHIIRRFCSPSFLSLPLSLHAPSLLTYFTHLGTFRFHPCLGMGIFILVIVITHRCSIYLSPSSCSPYGGTHCLLASRCHRVSRFETSSCCLCFASIYKYTRTSLMLSSSKLA